VNKESPEELDWLSSTVMPQSAVTLTFDLIPYTRKPI